MHRPFLVLIEILILLVLLRQQRSSDANVGNPGNKDISLVLQRGLFVLCVCLF